MWDVTVSENASETAQQLAEKTAELLQEKIDQNGKASLVVSGGKSPEQFLRKLSGQDIEWRHVSITLADERWVEEDDPASNAAFVRTNLLREKASEAYFLGLKNDAERPAEGIMECETALRTHFGEPDVVVLGMGGDGHTASWFPSSDDTAALMDLNNTAWCGAVEHGYPDVPRMSLTWRYISKAERIFLLFSGQEKNSVFTRATEKNDPALPVSVILHQNQVPVSVYHDETDH